MILVRRWLMAIDTLINEAKGMSDQDINEVIDFIRFIKIRSFRTDAVEKKMKYRQAGRLQGKIRMSEDFDAPLDDFKEYM